MESFQRSHLASRQLERIRADWAAVIVWSEEHIFLPPLLSWWKVLSLDAARWQAHPW